MEKIKITQATVCGKKTVAVGETVEASEEDARYLIALGKAVPVGGKGPKAKNRDDEVSGGLNTKSAGGLVSGGKGKK